MPIYPTERDEHPFAPYVRILGKGKHGSRGFTFEEAYDAMKMILNNEVEASQLGAFLMLLRVKEETSDELAGFVQAVRDWIPQQPLAPTESLKIDLDWSSYAGKRKQLPWYLLVCMLLADKGINVFMHGASGHTSGRLYSEPVLEALGIPICKDWHMVEKSLTDINFAYMPLRDFCKPLYTIIEMRRLMGLRSPVHSLARLINPLNAPYVIQGIFHPSYRPVHQEAGLRLGYQNLAVIKGDGGEIERTPNAKCLMQFIRDGKIGEETWAPITTTREPPADITDIQPMLDTWRGNNENEYGKITIISTTAMALMLLGKASTQTEADQLAVSYWESRNKGRL